MKQNYKIIFKDKKHHFNISLKEEEDNFFRMTALSDDNKVMGELNFNLFPRYAWIYIVETQEEFQHSGVASAMLEILEYFSVQSGACEVKGKFYPTNDYARPFYEKNGYYVPNKTLDWATYDETWTLSKRLNFDKVINEIEPKLTISEISKNSELTK